MTTATTVTAGRTKTATATDVSQQPPPMLSFLATMSGQGTADAGPTRTRLLLDKAVQLQDKGRLDDAHSLLTRALVACVCHAQLRSQFKDSGVPLDAIDPVGQCSCRDFVAAAQTRRPQKMSSGFGAPASGGDDVPFPITELDLSTVHRLATSDTACTCGSGRIRCTELDHLAALDRLAAVASKLGRHEDVSCIGQWYMDLAPQHAQGYLHVAKAVLALTAAKKKDGRLKDDVKREREQARFAARCLYTHGLHNVRAHGDVTSDLAQVLARCCRKYSHDDYLPDLPVETVEAIFQHLSLSDILACRRVSKRWALVLKRVRLRPAQVRFWGPKEAPVKGLQSLLRQMPDLKTDHLSIRYPDGTDTLRTARFVTLALGHFKDTESLELWMWSYWNPAHGNAFSPTTNVTTTETITTIEARLGPPPIRLLPAVSRCRRLVLHSHSDCTIRIPAGCLIAWASQSLESIELHGRFASDPFDFRMPRLRHAKMFTSRWGLGNICFTFMARVCVAAMRLEQLYLDDITFHTSPDVDDASEDEPVPPLDDALQHLNTLVIGPRCDIYKSSGGPAGYGGFFAFPPLPPGLRYLDILTKMEGLAHRIMFGGHYDPRITTPLPAISLRPLEHLESFRCLSPVDVPAHVFQLIEPSLCRPTGRLAHLELNARDMSTDFLRGRLPHMRIPFPERLRTIGLHDFNWSSTSAGSDVLIRDRVFLDWVAQFRNAETISVYPAWRHAAWTNGGSEGGRLVVALVEQVLRKAEADARADTEGVDKNRKDIDISQHLKLRTIYQGMLHGAMYERSMKLIGGHPIRIPQGHHDYRPSVFPWPDQEEEGSENNNDLQVQ